MTKRDAMATVFGLGLAATLVLAGCGSGGGGGGGTSSGAPAANSSAATTGAATGGAKGGGAATGGGAAAGTQGNYVMVKLTPNEQIFGAPGSPCPNTTSPSGTGPCFDQGGYMLDSTDSALPNKGKAGTAMAGKIPFGFLGNGGGKNAKEAVNFGPELGSKATIPVPAGQYKTMYILGAAGNGNKEADITFTYSDGTTGAATQNFDDWCQQPADGTVAFSLTDRLDGTGTASGCANSLYLDLYTVQVSSTSKSLKSLTFDSSGDTSGNFEPEILAITLEK